MIISPGRGYIFVHIPKTGGTSLALALEERAMKDDILIGDTPKARRRAGRLTTLQTNGRMWKHATLADIKGVVTPADFYVVTLVRNPWDRMVSYYHWLQCQNFDHPAVGRAKALPFGAFVEHPNTQQALRQNPYQSYVTDAEGVERCQLFARLETLEADLAPFWAYLGFSCAVGRHNRSDRRRDWRSYYTDQTAEAIAASCETDIHRFGYSFDGVLSDT